ncbi:MAG: LPS export ABC transporter permease LptG [Gammaproteobacteria bacterium]|nr:LPS export ABC transporter permease LptG [Gammaproteobacteria bacterium]
MKILDRYLIGRIAVGVGVATAVLLPLFSFLDLLEELEDVGEGSYELADAMRYVVLMIPRRLIQLAPFIALLGNVIALGRLAASLELVAMRAAGLSAMGIARASLTLGLMVVAALAALEQFVAPVLQQQAMIQRSAALAQSTELGSGLGIWIRDNRRVLRIGSMGSRDEPNDVEIMTFDAQGRMVEHLRSPHAEIVDAGLWSLNRVTRKRIDGGSVITEQLAELPWQPFLSPEQIATLLRPPESLSPTQLRELVAYLKTTGQEFAAYELALWRKAGGAVMLIAMLLLSTPFVFGFLHGGLGKRLVFAAVTGVGVYLLDQIVSNAGLLLELSPAFVALGPGVLLAIAGQQLLVRVR